MKEVLLNADLPVCRLKFDLQTQYSAQDAYAKVYKNGVAIGIQRFEGDSSWETFSQDFAGFESGDLIQIWAYSTNAASEARVKNMRFYYSNFMISIAGFGIVTADELEMTEDATISVTNQDP
ncbi:unnamed protein product [marine sediment metagenome]|uniref:Uncharacterized protein n=1 Tax=marine sediment metagenome TaxID=412755 RepID=X1QVD2_9ZZZZ